ncbi:MAG: DUF433 domain-containing protein [Gemmatimonadota bacterium]
MARGRSPIRRSPDVQGGEPVFAGTRIPLRALVDHLRSGGSLQGFLESWPDLPQEQVLSALVLALEELIDRERVPLGPPQGSLLPRTDGKQAVTNASELTAGLVVGRRVLCPACRLMVFQAWPEGWDSHAAHRCTGLHASDPELRKAEFKRRYEHLFR